jgi:hypothetical protein
MATTIQHQGQVATASGLDVLAGIWLLISPFVLGFTAHTAMVNNVIFGIIIGILALIRFFAVSRDTIWLSWLNAVLGLWVLVSPWFLRFGTYRTAATNNVIMGIIVIILACWSAIANTPGSDTRMNQPM